MEPKFHELLRIFSTFGYFKGHPIQKKVFGNSDNWKIGKLDIWIFGKSESRKLENPSLARAVASLARTGNTSKYLGAFHHVKVRFFIKINTLPNAHAGNRTHDVRFLK